ncbi:MAG: septum formation initiator family protein [Erysipelotrichaceae bacterium]
MAKAMKKHKLLVLILLLIAGFMLYKVGQEFVVTYNLHKDISEAEIIKAELIKDNEAYAEQKDNLEDEEYVKRYARGKYLMNQDGEQLFQMKKETR